MLDNMHQHMIETHVGIGVFHAIPILLDQAIASWVLAGMSLEAGQVYLRDDPVTWDSLRYGGTLYLGAETPFGPAFLSWGYTDQDRQRCYVSIGQRY